MMNLKPDWKRIGQSMMILGIIGTVCYSMLLIMSFFVLAEESWGLFNLWSIPKTVIAISGLILLTFGGWLVSGRVGPVGDM